MFGVSRAHRFHVVHGRMLVLGTLSPAARTPKIRNRSIHTGPAGTKASTLVVHDMTA